MTTFKTYASIALSFMAALILAPVLAFFGLVMLGLTFGLSLIAVGAVTAMALKAQTYAADVDEQPEPTGSKVEPVPS